ncbi:MAG: peptidylprolyl isomerase [Mycobacteriales bacterium]
MPGQRRERENERLRRARQQQRRAELAARRRRQSIIAGAVVVVAVIGVVIGLVVAGSGGKSKVTAGTTPSGSTSPSASPSASPTGTPVCDYIADPDTKTASSPGLPPDTKATGDHTATIVFTEGTVKIALSPKAPCTVNSFRFLAGKKYFDNTTCHRLTTSGIYVLQCGDPTGTGNGGPGYTIPDENLTGATYPAGTVAMANTGAAHSGGSQFFLVYKATQLPAKYTPFGKITSGLDVLTGIAAKGTNNSNGDGDGHPNEKVTIKSFTVS